MVLKAPICATYAGRREHDLKTLYASYLYVALQREVYIVVRSEGGNQGSHATEDHVPMINAASPDSSHHRLYAPRWSELCGHGHGSMLGLDVLLIQDASGPKSKAGGKPRLSSATSKVRTYQI